jgi:hypothetical protein
MTKALPDHRHRWIVKGDTSLATCADCGATKPRPREARRSDGHKHVWRSTGDGRHVCTTCGVLREMRHGPPRPRKRGGTDVHLVAFYRGANGKRWTIIEPRRYYK